MPPTPGNCQATPPPATVGPARLLALHGAEQAYAWGSPTAIPDLLGTPADGDPVAELWLGTHPVAPALAEADGVRLPAADLVGPLPFLLKVLAADKALSLQVHPDLDQARAGYDADEAAGLAVDGPERRYRDRNHKPELVVALTPFRALAGMRDPARTLAVVAGLGSPALAAAFRPLADDPRSGTATVLRTLLTMPAQPARALVRELITAAGRLRGGESPTGVDGPPDDLGRAADLVARLAAAHPGDVGIAAALLLNDVTLRPGEGLFQPARMLHAYVAGLGIEIMATSDNVLRGGLTPKHIDVDELLRILDPTPVAAPLLTPRTLRVGPSGLLRGWDVPVTDFVLTEAVLAGGRLAVGRPTVLLVVDGEVVADATADGKPVGPLTLRRGASALVTAPAEVTLTGHGRVFLAAHGG
ncbi:mannose-6-phosphate isomerase, class I [Frankia sp. AgB32]|uniref:mannose-6-phosphate isomerase, class I n=1 Tax=Frankia sp. AgB32 TaxID=631119 RepID=UPI00200DD352|nr:mannose-6-phosphate isomerase, class I [Frankia sp. AgB32]MCK9893800.1 mannose-6-phosphate isomerase, class I [Frankia sp. AgB32]